jgi:hypothetical protein
LRRLCELINLHMAKNRLEKSPSQNTEFIVP